MSERRVALERALSRAGAGSRSEARGWVAAGRVRVNGRVAGDARLRVDPALDRLEIDGRPVRAAAPAYLLLHKPKGVVTSRRDPQGRPTVFDLLPDPEPYLFAVGRLDRDTSGLLILTNDSRFAERLAHPRHGVPKTYEVKVSRTLTEGDVERLRGGVRLRDGPILPAEVRRRGNPGGKTVLEITIREGKNRQVRRMIETLGAKVVRLRRIAIGGVRLGELGPGEIRPLTPAEIRSLRGGA